MLCVLLTACAFQPDRPPEQRTTTVQVKVPVVVPCFTEDERPILAPSTPVADGATADQMASALRADIENEKLFTAAVDALFIRCVGAPK